MGLAALTTLFGLVIAIIGLGTSWLMTLLLVPLSWIVFYGGMQHLWRSMQSTHLSVRHGHLQLQRQLMGRDRGTPTRLHLSEAPTMTFVGVKGLKTMTIGDVTVPVHADQGNLNQLSELLNESCRLAMTEEETEVVPEALRAMLAAQRT